MTETKVVRLTETVKGAGWGSKLAPGDLDKALCGIEFPKDLNVIVGLDTIDDAGVYKINDQLALIQTVDFFTPIVDDPYCFGQIAAANALSDIYAMGGTPKTAMNLVAFPAHKMDIAILRQIINGGIDKTREAHVVMLGGHSVKDDELKYGLSVTGFIHPDKIIRKNNLMLGDKLILTKPIGTGIINTAIKAGIASFEVTDTVTRIMATLNQKGAEIMTKHPVHACTDITGFGLLGHLSEMLEGSTLGVRIDSHNLPVIPETDEYARMGLIPAGTYKNREYRETMVEFSSNVERSLQDILFDPQTSGGLLISVGGDFADTLVGDLKNNGVAFSTVIGEVVSGPKGKTVVV